MKTSSQINNIDKGGNGGKILKATGIVRRIDELGRVVIPKEIRRTLRIREGDPLEIYTEREGEVILKKYSMIGDMGRFAKQYADSLGQITGNIILITDRDMVIAVSSGAKAELVGKKISKHLEQLINERNCNIASADDSAYCMITDESEVFASQVIYPIISEGDIAGAVVFLTRDRGIRFGETEKKLAAAAAIFLGKQMES